MKLQIFLTAVCCAGFVTLGHGRILPSFIHKCKYTSDGDKLSECLTSRFNEQRDIFLHGVPELQIPSLDPMVIDKIVFNTGNGSSVSLDTVFTNITLYGCSDVQIKKMKVDIDNKEATIETYFPKMRVLANYKMKGRFLILQLDGSGISDGNFTEIHSKDHYKGRHIKKRNKTYLDWYSKHMDLDIGTANLYFYDLFKGNPDLTESTNRVINDNALEIINDLKPLVQETISTVTFTIMNRIFKLYSLEELFD